MTNTESPSLKDLVKLNFYKIFYRTFIDSSNFNYFDSWLFFLLFCPSSNISQIIFIIISTFDNIFAVNGLGCHKFVLFEKTLASSNINRIIGQRFGLGLPEGNFVTLLFYFRNFTKAHLECKKRMWVTSNNFRVEKIQSTCILSIGFSKFKITWEFNEYKSLKNRCVRYFV